jgi:hypothetical protein
MRMQHSGPIAITPSEHGHNGYTSNTGNTETPNKSDTDVALEEMREQLQRQGEQLEALRQTLEYQSGITVIPLSPHAGAEPVQPAGETGRSPNYGKLTAAVLEAIQDRERFTSAEIAQVLGRKPTSIWQALQGLVKKGVLRQRGRYGEAVYIRIKRDD